jgi:protease I
MTATLSGKTIAFLVANEGIEQVELTRPWDAVKEAGGTPKLVAPKVGKAQAFNHLDKADAFDVDITTQEADPGECVVLPGGVANPDQFRMDDAAMRFLQEIAAADKPIAAICHGPWTLVEADLVRGKTITSWPSQTDIRNAGGRWVDQESVIDGKLLSSRKPDDLDAFCPKMLALFAGA